MQVYVCLVPDIRFDVWNVNRLLWFLLKYLDLVKETNNLKSTQSQTAAAKPEIWSFYSTNFSLPTRASITHNADSLPIAAKAASSCRPQAEPSSSFRGLVSSRPSNPWICYILKLHVFVLNCCCHLIVFLAAPSKM